MPLTIFGRQRQLFIERLLCFLIVLLFACEKDADMDFVFHKFSEGGQTLIVDRMNNSYNYILYIGTDTTLYDINGDDDKVPYKYFYQPLLIADSLDSLAEELENVSFKILVDTASSVQIPFYPDVPEDIPGPQISEWTDSNRKMVNAYPVYIWNPTDKTTSIPVQGVATEIIQEAKDEKGNWRPIEFWVSGFCGNGKWDYILKPNYYAVTSVYKYSGEFQTDLRIKFRRGTKVYYSDSFKGTINKKQFETGEYFNRPDNFLDNE
jgi:hypothetical protein